MTKLVDDKKFQEFLTSKRGLYQPIPISGLFNPKAVRAEGCIRRWNAISQVLPKNKSQRILDIGCSLGFFGFVAADAGHVVDGFDTDGEGIYWANRVIGEFDLPNITLWQSGEDLLQELQRIPDDTYDYVFYFSLHHHMCAALGIKGANKILQEMSRIAPNMIFDMGQSNEVDNGWLTWLKKVPKFKNHRVELADFVLTHSGFNYAACIGDSRSHEIDRMLFLFVRNTPKDVDYSRKLITMGKTKESVSRGYNVKEYKWKNRGGKGTMHSSTTGFPIMDLKSSMAARYYLLTDLGGIHYFAKEFLYCWLSPNVDYELARKTYERGKTLGDIKEISHRVVIPTALVAGIIVYPYYNWPALHTVDIKDFKHNFLDELIEIIGRIYREIGVFDLNPNNILYNNETGEFKLIDFEPAYSANFTFKVFLGRITYIWRSFFAKAFGEDK